jgi:hypothetical protein
MFASILTTSNQFAVHVPEVGLRVEPSTEQLYVRVPVKPESQSKVLVP